MIALSELRAQAQSLARQLPGLSMQAAAADVIHPGAAGRRRAGTGEQFWQYRHYAQTDAADRIDWRRSARGHDYFVRETELETARTILFWCDPAAGFDWAGAAPRDHKADRARVLMLANAINLAKSGERIGMLTQGRAASLGTTAADKLAEDFLDSTPRDLSPPRAEAIAIIASDFYDPIPEWQARLAPLAARCRHGVLLVVSDPVEHEFPWSGRTRFSRPGSEKTRTFGRAETVRTEYIARLEAHQKAMDDLAARMGWALVRHRTDNQALRGAAALQIALEGFGSKA